MSLHLPLSTSGLASLLLGIPYDFSSPDPHLWRLGLGLATATATALQAVSTGELSAVPPEELPNQNVAPLQPPQPPPPVLDLYLRPLFFPASQLRSVNAALQAAGLGERLRGFVYRNVALSSLAPSVLAALDAFRPLPDDVGPGDRLSLFAQGELAVPVAAGDDLAQVSVSGSPLGPTAFAVWTTTGFVDPVAFFTALHDLLVLADQALLLAFAQRFGSHWPDPALDTPTHTIAACQSRLFPYPALAEARLRLGLSANDWAAVGVGQKAIYWQQLLTRAGHATAAAPFAFNREDMANPFQLDAMSDFFLHWPEPRNPASPPPPAVSPAALILLQPGIHLVAVDPFDLPLLGRVPGPAFHLATYLARGLLCVPGAQIAEDTYTAMLFLIHDGEIVAWFRWSTYSSHQWEDSNRIFTDDDGHPRLLGSPLGPLCAWAASIKGNARYSYRAEPAQTSSFINFGFLVWDPSRPGESAPCRFYFRPGSPSSFDQDRRIMIHLGLSADNNPKNAAWSYNGSASGLVSPEFYKLRNLMIERHLIDYERIHGGPDPAVLPLRNAGATLSVSLFKNEDNQRATWSGAIAGSCWVIRPNEPEGA